MINSTLLLHHCQTTPRIAWRGQGPRSERGLKPHEAWLEMMQFQKCYYFYDSLFMTNEFTIKD